MELSQWTVLYTELYVACGRFVEESWRSQIPRRLIRGYMCVWRPTWLESEKVIRLSSLCLVRNVCLKKHKLFVFFTSDWWVIITPQTYIYNLCYVHCPSRETSVCATACEPGGLSGRKCRVQVSGPRWPSAYAALEKGWRGYSPRKVSNVCCLSVFALFVYAYLYNKSHNG